MTSPINRKKQGKTLAATKRKNGLAGARPTTQGTAAAEPPSDSGSALGRSISYALRRAQLSTYGEYSRFMDGFGVRPSEFSVLVLVGRHPGLSQSALGVALEIKKANLVPLLDGLEKGDMLERRLVPTDRRLVALHLTPRGAARLSKMEARHDEMEAELQRRLGVTRSRQLLKLLQEFTRAQRNATKMDSSRGA